MYILYTFYVLLIVNKKVETVACLYKYIYIINISIPDYPPFYLLYLLTITPSRYNLMNDKLSTNEYQPIMKCRLLIVIFRTTHCPSTMSDFGTKKCFFYTAPTTCMMYVYNNDTVAHKPVRQAYNTTGLFTQPRSV